jgi:hypothetical protein
VDNPAKHAKADEPNDARANKEEQGREHTTLDQLPKAWKKEAANSRDYIARRSLVFIHGKNILPPSVFRKRFPSYGTSGFSMTCPSVFGSACWCPGLQQRLSG